MGYVNVKDFINSLKQKPEDYDFNGQSGVKWAENEYVIDQYFIDRATGLVNKSSDPAFTQPLLKCLKHPELLNYDCDGSQGECDEKCRLIHEIYGELWGWEKNKKTFGYVQSDIFGFQFGGDTMNSVQTPLNSFVYICGDTNEKISLNRIITAFIENDEKIVGLINSNEGLLKYIERYHTIGNFCLVPYGFNGYRGNPNNHLNDYWDKSLAYLKDKGFEEFDPKKHFFTYINSCFLWDYVDEKYNIKTYSDKLFDLNKLLLECINNVCYNEAIKIVKKPGRSPKQYTVVMELAENYIKEHSENTDERYHKVEEFLKNINKQKNIVFNEFFNAAVKRIERRGIFMVAMLRLQQNMGEKIYEKIRQKVFATDAVYNGYEDVFEKIKKILSENGLNSSDLCDAQERINKIS